MLVSGAVQTGHGKFWKIYNKRGKISIVDIFQKLSSDELAGTTDSYPRMSKIMGLGDSKTYLSFGNFVD